MYIRLPQRARIIYTNDFFAHLVGMSDDNLVYEVRYGVDRVKIVETNAQYIVATARVGTQQNIANAPQITEPSEMIQRILTAPSRRKSRSAKASASVISTTQESIASCVDPEMRQKIRQFQMINAIKHLDFRGVIGESEPIFYSSKIMYSNVADMNNEKPLLEIDSSAVKFASFDRTQRLTNTTFMKALFTGNTDPASAANLPPNTISTQQSMCGTAPTNIPSAPPELIDLNMQLTSAGRAFTDVVNSSQPDLTIANTEHSALDMKQGVQAESPKMSIDDSTLSPADVSKVSKLLEVTSNNEVPQTTTSNIKSNGVVPILVRVPDNVRWLKLLITVPRSKLQSNEPLTIMLEVVNDQNVMLDSLTSSVDYKNDIVLFKTPTLAPEVKIVSNVDNNSVTLQITQLDKSADTVQIMQRSIPVNSTDIGEHKFEVIDTIKVTKKDGASFIKVPVSKSNITMFRCVPIGDTGIKSTKFSSAVAKSPRIQRHIGASIVTNIADNGVRVTVMSTPIEAISCKILRRDTTQREKTFTQVGTFDETRLLNGGSDLAFIDQDTKPKHVYEYKAEFFFTNGDTNNTTANSTIKYIPKIIGKLSEKITNESLSTDMASSDFTFKIETTIKPTPMQSMKELLVKNNMQEPFKKELDEKRDEMNDIVVHNVTRVNLTSGDIEDMGSLTSNTFSAVEQQKITNAKPMLAGNVYEYRIEAIASKPEIVLDNVVKTLKDESSQREYSFSPAKFQSLVSLEDGNIPTKKSMELQHVEQNFMQGSVESVIATQIAIKREQPTVNALTTNLVSDTVAKLAWTTDGDSSNIDHFSISRVTSLTSDVIGSAMPSADSNTFEYMHTLDSNDVGKVTYVVTPVYGNFSPGQPVLSNVVTISQPVNNAMKEFADSPPISISKEKSSMFDEQRSMPSEAGAKAKFKPAKGGRNK